MVDNCLSQFQVVENSLSEYQGFENRLSEYLIISFWLNISYLLIISFWLTFSDTTIDYYQQQPEGLVQASHSTMWLKIPCHEQYQEIADNQEIADVKCQSTKW